MIENGRFTIEVDRALPMGGRTVHLTTPYSLEMRGDSAISYLPYFGRAYSLPYGGIRNGALSRILAIGFSDPKILSVSMCKYFQMVPRS